MSPLGRLLAGAVVTDRGCWEWQRARLPRGYGRMYINGRLGYTHRIAYELLVGPIPAGHQLDHLCRNTACCNPAHLEPVTPRENTRRGLRGELPMSCKRGHPWTDENTVRRRDGRRRCRECSRLSALARRRGAESPT